MVSLKNKLSIQYIYHMHKDKKERFNINEGIEQFLEFENIVEEEIVEKTEGCRAIYKTRKLAVIKGKVYIGNKPSEDYIENVKYTPIFSKIWDCKINGGDGDDFYYKELEGKILYNGEIYSKINAKYFLDVVNDDGAVKLKIKLVK